MLPLIYLLWRHQWGTYIDSSDINLFPRWRHLDQETHSIQSSKKYLSPGACPEALWKSCGRVEHRSDLLYPPLRLPAFLRWERCKSIRSDSQRLEDSDSDFVIHLFFLRRIRVRLAILGRYQRRGKRLHSLTHVCQRREQTYLPVSFLQFTFTFMSSWSLSLSILWLFPLCKSQKTCTFLPV